MEYHQTLAAYATHPHQSRGRFAAEDEDTTRSPHQRDRDRIIHCAAFRRLEYKTQVFVNHEGDHYRTRLTHSLEVSQLSRSMCRFMRLNEDLGEALALAHDLGHTPFGHAGEDGLNAAMERWGGFDHNAQTLRILTRLETRYASFDGLNLTWETLEGIIKHNGPVHEPPRAMRSFEYLDRLDLHEHAGLEAQLASLADDIAYNNHDIEDGLRAGFFTLEELAGLPLLREIITEVRTAHPDINSRRLTHEVIRRMINHMVNDVIATTSGIISQAHIKTAQDVRSFGKPVAQFSGAMQEVNRQIKHFLMTRVYRHYKVNRMTSKARRVVSELFAFFMEEPHCMPPAWYEQTLNETNQQRAETVADFIAGMTDRFALEEHARIFDPMART